MHCKFFTYNSVWHNSRLGFPHYMTISVNSDSSRIVDTCSEEALLFQTLCWVYKVWPMEWSLNKSFSQFQRRRHPIYCSRSIPLPVPQPIHASPPSLELRSQLSPLFSVLQTFPFTVVPSPQPINMLKASPILMNPYLTPYPQLVSLFSCCWNFTHHHHLHIS